MGENVTLDVKRIELDILEAAHTGGRIGYFNGDCSPATKALNEKYSTLEDQQQLTVVMAFLTEERYTFPIFDTSGKLQHGYIRGITPKGQDRLQELKHPIRTWAKANWFAVVVAFTSASIGVASVIANVIVKGA